MGWKILISSKIVLWTLIWGGRHNPCEISEHCSEISKYYSKGLIFTLKDIKVLHQTICGVHSYVKMFRDNQSTTQNSLSLIKSSNLLWKYLFDPKYHYLWGSVSYENAPRQSTYYPKIK